MMRRSKSKRVWMRQPARMREALGKREKGNSVPLSPSPSRLVRNSSQTWIRSSVANIGILLEFTVGSMAVRTTGAGGARAPLTSKAGGLSPPKKDL